MASTFFKNLKRVSLGSVALALVVGASSTAEAVPPTKTWVGGGYSTVNQGRAWGSANNWSPSGVPTSSDIANFVEPSGTSYFTVNLGANRSVNGLTFGNASNNYSINGAYNLTVGASGIVADASDGGGGYWEEVVAATINLDANQTWSGRGSLQLSSVDTKGYDLTVRTTTTISNLAAAASANFIVDSVGTDVGAVQVINGVGPAQFEVKGGTLEFTDPTGNPTAINVTNTDLLVNGGTFKNLGFSKTFADVNLQSGSIQVNDPTDPTSTGTLTAFSYLQTGGTINMAIASTSSYSKLVTNGPSGAGDITFGGTLNLAWNAGSPSLTNYSTTWNLFQKPGDGSFSGNFSNVTMTAPAGSAFDGYSTFAQWGQEWRTSPNTNGQYLVFQSQNGNLVVVPEPSTYASAALGLTLAGVAQWVRSRRRSVAVIA